MPDKTPPPTSHLVERAAALLRAEAGLAPADPAAEGVSLAAALSEADPPPPRQPAPQSSPQPPQPPPLSPPRPGHVEGAAPAVTMAALQHAGLVLGGGRSRATEEYRITVGRLLRTLRAGRPGRAGSGNLLMVTSARPGEGKSFSALNLAASIAQNGLAEALLVDVDGKRHSLSAQLGLGGRSGLLDLAADPSLRPETAVVASALAGLALVPHGTTSEAGARTASGSSGTGVTRAVGIAIERLGRRFPHHVVILDTAPCLSTSDPSALAPLVDATVMVVEAQRTQRSELEAALDLVRACPNVTLVLNKIQLVQRHSFGSYYYFDEAS
jgi:protein-tyrosine kinase